MKKNNFNAALALLLSFFSAATFAQNNGSFVLGSGTITSDASGIGINVDSGVTNGSTAVAIQHFDSINIAQNQALSVQNNTGSNLRNFISADGSIYIAGSVQAAGGNPMSLSMIGAGGVVIADTANISTPGAFIAASGTLTNDGVTPDVTINLNSAGVDVNPAAQINAGSSAIGESSVSYVASEDGAYLPFVAGNTFSDLDHSVTIDAAGHAMQADGVVSNYGAMTVNNSPEVTLNNLNLMNSAIAGLASEQFITDNNTTVHINDAVQYGAASKIYAGNFVLGGTNNGFLKIKTLNSDSVVDFGGATNNGSISIEGVNDSVVLTGAVSGTGSLRADAGGVSIYDANLAQDAININGLSYGVTVSNSTLNGYKRIEGALASSNSTYQGDSYFDYGDLSFTDDIINGLALETGNNTGNVSFLRTSVTTANPTLKSTGNISLTDSLFNSDSLYVAAAGDVLFSGVTGNFGIAWVKANNITIDNSNITTSNIAYTDGYGTTHSNYDATNNLSVTNSTLTASTHNNDGGKVLVLGASVDDSAGTNKVDSENYFFGSGGGSTTKTGTETTDTSLAGLTLSAANITLNGATLQNKAAVITDPVTDPVTTPVTDPVVDPVTDPVVDPVTDPVTVPVCVIGSNACGAIPVITTPTVPVITPPVVTPPTGTPTEPVVKPILPAQPHVYSVQVAVNDKPQNESRGNVLLIGGDTGDGDVGSVTINKGSSQKTENKAR